MKLHNFYNADKLYCTMALKPLKTEDSTYTFFDDEYREAMHSLSGAYREALYMHVLPSRVLEKEGTVCVLDVGLGLGYNVLALLYEARKRNDNAFYHIVSFEKNPAIPCTMETIMFHDDRDELYKLIRKAAIEKEVTTAWYNHVVLYGDARKLIASMPEDYFDAVFHDPFSPAKNPELWTVDFFKKIYHVCRDDGIVTTYSAAFHIRAAMHQAGFRVGIGPQVGRKKEGTIATRKNADVVPLGDDYFTALKTMAKAIPFTDELLCDDPELIRQRRHEAMHDFKKDHQALE